MFIFPSIIPMEAPVTPTLDHHPDSWLALPEIEAGIATCENDLAFSRSLFTRLNRERHEAAGDPRLWWKCDRSWCLHMRQVFRVYRSAQIMAAFFRAERDENLARRPVMRAGRRGAA